MQLTMTSTVSKLSRPPELITLKKNFKKKGHYARVCELCLLEERLFGSKWFLLGEKGSEVSAGARVGELGRGFGCTARVLYVQVVHQQNLPEIHAPIKDHMTRGIQVLAVSSSSRFRVQ